MYHTFKNKEKDKEVKPPKGWHFSGDPSFLKLANSDFSVYFHIVNTGDKLALRTGVIAEKSMKKWEVEEYHGQTGIKINHARRLSDKEAKKFAVKLAKNLNKERFMDKIKWIIVPVLLGVLLGALGTFIVNYLLGD